MAAELKDLTHAYQESDKRRKNAESALSEAQSRISEDTSRTQELSSQNDRMKVKGYHLYKDKSVAMWGKLAVSVMGETGVELVMVTDKIILFGQRVLHTSSQSICFTE